MENWIIDSGVIIDAMCKKEAGYEWSNYYLKDFQEKQTPLFTSALNILEINHFFEEYKKINHISNLNSVSEIKKIVSKYGIQIIDLEESTEDCYNKWASGIYGIGNKSIDYTDIYICYLAKDFKSKGILTVDQDIDIMTNQISLNIEVVNLRL